MCHNSVTISIAAAKSAAKEPAFFGRFPRSDRRAEVRGLSSVSMDATHDKLTDDEREPGRGDRQAYELLDFGRGRKLERFGEYVLDRPVVGHAEDLVERPEHWSHATARFEIDTAARASSTSGQRGKWKPNARLSPGMAIPGLGGSLVGQNMPTLPERWTIACGGLLLELKPTAFGHVGFFPEQIENWQWIARQLCEPSRQRQSSERRLKILNLFAHTGGSTLAAAAAGAEVVHVDSARAAVAWARRNAELSGLAEAPIRWIVEDAVRFVRREFARQRVRCRDSRPAELRTRRGGRNLEIGPRSARVASRLREIDRSPDALRIADLPLTRRNAGKCRTVAQRGDERRSGRTRIDSYHLRRSPTAGRCCGLGK